MPVLDATFLIDAKRAPALVARAMEFLDPSEESNVVPMQAALEYAAGTPDASRAFRELGESFTLRPFDADVAREAHRIAHAARARGVFPGWADVQIAATAAYEGMFILSRNVRHLRDALGATVWDYCTDSEPPR